MTNMEDIISSVFVAEKKIVFLTLLI